MNLRRLRLLAPASLAALALTLTACGSDSPTTSTPAAPGEQQTVRFTVFPGAMASMGVYVADALGFFGKQGLTVEYVNVATGSSALQVLAAGQTDFAISDVTGTATARAAGSDIVFASGQFTLFAGRLACRSAAGLGGSYPDSMKSLAGRKVGITAPGSSTDTYLRYSLKEAGVDPAEVEIIPIGGIPQLVAAMQSGNVDCVTAYQPMPRLLSDVDVLVDWQAGEGPDTFSDYSYNAIATSERFAGSNPEAVRKVNAAMKEAAEFANDKGNAAEIAGKTLTFFQGLDEAALAEVTAELAGTFGADITEQQLRNAATVFEAVNGKPLDVSYEQLVAEPVRE
ncbi:MAG TPA: ABC transporter substrate-binding protein [Pseudonocardiaceae bacterium]